MLLLQKGLTDKLCVLSKNVGVGELVLLDVVKLLCRNRTIHDHGRGSGTGGKLLALCHSKIHNAVPAPEHSAMRLK